MYIRSSNYGGYNGGYGAYGDFGQDATATANLQAASAQFAQAQGAYAADPTNSANAAAYAQAQVNLATAQQQYAASQNSGVSAKDVVGGISSVFNVLAPLAATGAAIGLQASGKPGVAMPGMMMPGMMNPGMMPPVQQSSSNVGLAVAIVGGLGLMAALIFMMSTKKS